MELNASHSDPSLESTLKGHRQSINSLSFSSDGQQLVSGGDDSHVILWSLRERQPICYRMTGHTSAVTSVCFGEHFIASASKDCTVRLWKLSKISAVNKDNDTLINRCHTSSVRSVDIHPDSSQFCTASDDKTIKLWSSSGTNKFIASLSGGHCNWVRSAKYSKLNTHLIASCGDDGNICVWDTRTKDAAIKLQPKRRATHYLSLVWHPIHEQLLSSSSVDASIRIWDLRHKKMIQYYAAHEGPVNCIDFHSMGHYLLSAAGDEKSKIFDLLEGRVLFTLKAHTGSVNCAAFSLSGEYFATAGNDKIIQLWKSNLLDDGNGNDESIIDDQICESQHNEEERSKIWEQRHNETIRPLKSALRTKSECTDQMKRLSFVEDNEIGSDKNPIVIEGSGDGSVTAREMLGVSQRIITQLQILTESVSLIQRRLSILEKKFHDHCNAESSSSNGH